VWLNSRKKRVLDRPKTKKVKRVESRSPEGGYTQTFIRSDRKTVKACQTGGGKETGVNQTLSGKNQKHPKKDQKTHRGEKNPEE